MSINHSVPLESIVLINSNACGVLLGSCEPPHDKTNKMSVRPAKTQISLCIRPVWSDSSLCAQWIAKDPSFLHEDPPGWSESSLGAHSFYWFCHVAAHVVCVISWQTEIIADLSESMELFSHRIFKILKAIFACFYFFFFFYFIFFFKYIIFSLKLLLNTYLWYVEDCFEINIKHAEIVKKRLKW